MYLTTLIGGRRETNALENGSYMIGRSASCRLCLPFPDVSERHAVLTVRHGRAVLEDLHSATGTYVTGARVAEAAVVVDHVAPGLLAAP